MNWKAYRAFLASLGLLLLFAGCAVGPKYTRPEYPVPAEHRSETALPAAAPAAAAPTLGDVKWFDLFRDEKLQELIRTALKDNYDIRIAAQRVLAAQAFITVEKSALYPSLNAEVSADQQRGVNRGLSSVFGGGTGLLGAGHMGQNSPPDRGGPGAVSGTGGRSAGRDSEPGDRSGQQLLSIAGVGSGTGSCAAVSRFPPWFPSVGAGANDRAESQTSWRSIKP